MPKIPGLEAVAKLYSCVFYQYNSLNALPQDENAWKKCDIIKKNT